MTLAILDKAAALLTGAATKPKLQVYLCAPRGFCAGVVRAIDAVDQALRLYGAPVYVRHEIVHNKYVVEGLKAEGRGLRRGALRGARHHPAGDLLGSWRAQGHPGRRRRGATFTPSTRPARW